VLSGRIFLYSYLALFGWLWGAWRIDPSPYDWGIDLVSTVWSILLILLLILLFRSNKKEQQFRGGIRNKNKNRSLKSGNILRNSISIAYFSTRYSISGNRKVFRYYIWMKGKRRKRFFYYAFSCRTRQSSPSIPQRYIYSLFPIRSEVDAYFPPPGMVTTCSWQCMEFISS